MKNTATENKPAEKLGTNHQSTHDNPDRKSSITYVFNTLTPLTLSLSVLHTTQPFTR